MLKHVRKFHSELAKGQTGGAVSTRGMKKDIESTKIDPKPVKDEPRAVKRKLEDDVDMSHLLEDGLHDFLVERANRLELSENPLFKANRTFLPYKRQGLKGAVKKEQFTVTFDQLRKPTGEESLGEGLSESLLEAVRDTILKENLRDSTKLHLTLTSKRTFQWYCQFGIFIPFEIWHSRKGVRKTGRLRSRDV